MNNMNNTYYTPGMLKSIRNKRTGKILKIWGWIIAIFGLMALMGGLTMPGYSYSDLFFDAAVALIGAVLISMGIRRQKKWDRYEALINQKGNTPIPYLVQALGKSSNEVMADLQTMVNSKFFALPNGNTDAYIDGQYNMLVMTMNGMPLEPLEKTAERMRQENLNRSRKEAEAAARAKMAAENRAASEPIRAIRNAILDINDEEVRDTLFALEGSVKRIEDKVEKNPELKNNTNVKKLNTLYLPQMLELVKKLQKGEGSDETLESIKSALKVCVTAFENLEDKISEKEDIDTMVDIEVLKRTLEREGLLGSDFDFK